MKYVHELILLIAFAMGGLLACSSSPVKDFENVREGMPKYDVLEAMGVPQRSERWHGKDRWTYMYVEAEKPQTKEIHFQDGKVIYKGDPVLPAVNAAEQDKLNEDSNSELEKKYAEKREQIRTQTIDKPKDAGNATDSQVPRFVPIE